MTTITIGATEVTAHRDDLTRMKVDAVVNAANEDLVHGGGLAAALARAGGPAVQAESTRWVAAHGPVTPGRAAVTTAGDMPAQMVVHVAGPIYRRGQDNEGLLRKAVAAALAATLDAGAATVALPAISAGIFGYPLQDAAATIASEAVRWVRENPGLEAVHLVGFDDAAAGAFAAGLQTA